MSDRREVEQALAYARKSGTGWWRTNCPLCLGRTGKADRKGALAINPRFGVYQCWKCQASGTIARPSNIPDDEPGDVVPPAMVAPEGFVPLAGDESLSLEPAREYVAGRVPEDRWEEAQIGACARGPYAGRVIIPILAENGITWLGWVGRTWTKKGIYTYPKGMPRGEVLYRGWVLTEESEEPALGVEGVFDALHLWPDAFALLGKASEIQMEALAVARRPVVMVLDGDAWLEACAMAMRLRLYGCRAGYVRLPPKTDPDEVPRSWLDEEVRRAL